MSDILPGSYGTQIDGYPLVTNLLPTDYLILQRITAPGPIGSVCIQAANLPGAGVSTYDVAMNYVGVPPTSQVFLAFVVVREFSIASGFTLSQAVFVTPPTNQVQLTVNYNGSPIGTVTWAANAGVGVFAGAGQQSLTAGSLIEIVSGGNVYAAADLVLTIAGTIP